MVRNLVGLLRTSAVLCGIAGLCLSGCGQTEAPGPDDAAANAAPGSPVTSKADEDLSRIINEATTRFTSLDYAFNEDLLRIVDETEAYLAAAPEARKSMKVPRHLSKLDEQEELDHFRSTITNWEAKTGKKLRAEIDRTKAAVAKRAANDKEAAIAFNKDFSATFDEFIKVEVNDLRERRNRWIHDRAAPLIEEIKSKTPAEADRLRKILDTPPYDLPSDKAKAA